MPPNQYDGIYPVSVSSDEITVRPFEHTGRGVLNVDGIDSAFRRFYAERGGLGEPSIIDLSEVEYLEQGTLLHLGALAAYRKRKGWPVQIRLPRSTHAINWMRTCEFPNFIEFVTKTPFADLLDDDSTSRFCDLVARGKSEFDQDPPVGGTREPIHPKRVLYLSPIQNIDRACGVSDAADRATRARLVAAITSDKLREQQVYDLLDTFIPRSDRDTKQGGGLVSAILEEFVQNSVMHSSPSLGYVYGSFDYGEYNKRTRSKGFFGLSAWDNGLPATRIITNAMGERLEPSRVMNSAAAYAHEVFRVRYTGPGFANPQQTVIRVDGMDDVANLLSRREAYRALALFLPGVTSEPERKSVPTSTRSKELPGDPLPASESEKSGTGLYRVCRMAVDILDGRIDYASGQIRVRIQQYKSEIYADARPDYQVDLEYGTQTVWPIEGNLFTCRLPGEWPA